MKQAMAELPFAATTPISVARVGLAAKNADALADYYRKVVGLSELSRTDGTITLGAAERPLLVIRGDLRRDRTIREARVCSIPLSCCRHAPISAAG